MFKPIDDEYGQGVPCFFYTNNKGCMGNLHYTGFLENNMSYNKDMKYKCKCDKCGAEIILDFNPDLPKKIY